MRISKDPERSKLPEPDRRKYRDAETPAEQKSSNSNNNDDDDDENRETQVPQAISRALDIINTDRETAV